MDRGCEVRWEWRRRARKRKGGGKQFRQLQLLSARPNQLICSIAGRRGKERQRCERTVISNIVNDDDTVSSSVVGGCDGSETLLSCRRGSKSEAGKGQYMVCLSDSTSASRCCFFSAAAREGAAKHLSFLPPLPSTSRKTAEERREDRRTNQRYPTTRSNESSKSERRESALILAQRRDESTSESESESEGGREGKEV